MKVALHSKLGSLGHRHAIGLEGFCCTVNPTSSDSSSGSEARTPDTVDCWLVDSRTFLRGAQTICLIGAVPTISQNFSFLIMSLRVLFAALLKHLISQVVSLL